MEQQGNKQQNIKEERELLNKREEHAVRIRREKREEKFSKRRQIDRSEVYGGSTDIFKNPDQLFCKSNSELNKQLKIEIERVQDNQFRQEDFEKYVEVVRTGDIIQKHLGILAIRKIISVDNGPLHLVAEHQLLGVLLEGLQQEEYQRLRVECGWALANIASATGPLVDQLVAGGRGIQIILEVLGRQQSVDLDEQLMWCLGNLATENSGYRNSIVEQGGMVLMLGAMQQARELMVVVDRGDPEGVGPQEAQDKQMAVVLNRFQEFTWALSNLLRLKPLYHSVHNIQVFKVFLEVLQQDRYNNDAVENDVTWAILGVMQHYCDQANNVNNPNLDSEAMGQNYLELVRLVQNNTQSFRRVVKNLRSDHQRLQTASLRLVEQLTRADHLAKQNKKGLMQALIVYGVIKRTATSLRHSLQKIQQISIQILTNLVIYSKKITFNIASNKQIISASKDLLRDPTTNPKVLKSVLDFIGLLIKRCKDQKVSYQIVTDMLDEIQLLLKDQICDAKKKNTALALSLLQLMRYCFQSEVNHRQAILKRQQNIQTMQSEQQIQQMDQYQDYLQLFTISGAIVLIQQFLFHSSTTVVHKTEQFLKKYVPVNSFDEEQNY